MLSRSHDIACGARSRERLAIKPPLLSLGSDLLLDLLLYLCESFEEELLYVASLVQDDLGESLDLLELSIFAAHNLSQV